MRLHLAIADGLETESQPDVFAIAHHLRLAVPAASAERVATALLLAARRARELCDFDLSRALPLWQTERLAVAQRLIHHGWQLARNSGLGK